MRDALSNASFIQQFWDSWSTEERCRLEEEALELATPMQRKMLERGRTLAEATEKSLLTVYALQLMQQGICMGTVGQK